MQPALIRALCGGGQYLNVQLCQSFGPFQGSPALKASDSDARCLFRTGGWSWRHCGKAKGGPRGPAISNSSCHLGTPTSKRRCQDSETASTEQTPALTKSGAASEIPRSLSVSHSTAAEAMSQNPCKQQERHELATLCARQSGLHHGHEEPPTAPSPPLFPALLKPEGAVPAALWKTK